MNQFRCDFCSLIGIDIPYPYSRFKKTSRSRFRENQQSVSFGQNWAQKGPKKWYSMYKSTWYLHHSIDIDAPIIMQSKKNVGAVFEKNLTS